MIGMAEEISGDCTERQPQEEGKQGDQRPACWQGVGGDKVGTDRPEDW